MSYAVKLGIDVNLADLQRLLYESIQQVSGSEDALLVVYFSGHGFESSEGLFLTCADSSPKSPNLGMSISEVLGIWQLLGRGCRACVKPTIVLLADCCRTPLEEADLPPQFGGFGLRGLQRHRDYNHDPGNHRNDFFILYACDRGHSALDTKRHGCFTESFLRHLTQTTTVASLFEAIAADVQWMTCGRQRPVLCGWGCRAPTEIPLAQPSLEGLHSPNPTTFFDIVKGKETKLGEVDVEHDVLAARQKPLQVEDPPVVWLLADYGKFRVQELKNGKEISPDLVRRTKKLVNQEMWLGWVTSVALSQPIV